jgi:hypothetical protein
MTTIEKPVNNRIGKGTGLRPHVWKSGPDATAHDSYCAWLQCRNQANYRKEGWCLTFDEWQAHWAGMWHRRGRSSQELCITRLDCSRPWSTENVIIITRRQNAQRKAGLRTGQGQGPSDVVLDRSWAAKALT